MPAMSHGVRRFTQLRAWQACVAYKKAVYALCEVGGLMEYLQSPEALRNARHARERRIASRPEHRKARKLANNEPETEDEPETEHERSSENPEE
jgi:hypothetical protein